MNFEKASRIGIKISFIKIAGVLARGESTGAILAVRINKRHAAFHNEKTLFRVKLSTEHTSQMLKKS